MSRLKSLPAHLALALSFVGMASAQDAPKDSVRKFYKGLTFGSEAQFNPLTEVLNEGFDMLRIENAERRLGYLQYKQAASNVWRSISHPDGAIRRYGGLWEMMSREVLPL